jgi:tripartite-type tricarboxylate transporter receptor subunit TctC
MINLLFSFLSFIFLTGFTWTTNPITIIVPFSAGGATDILARHIEVAIETNSNLSVVVLNQGGGSGIIGMRSFVQKNRSLFLATETIITNKNIFPDSYPNEIIDMALPIHFFTNSPYVVYANTRFNDVFSLIETSKARDILVGTAAPGSGSFTMYDILCNKNKILNNCRRVGYKSGGDATLDLYAGRLDIFSSLISTNLLGMETVKPLMIMSKKRSSFLPNVPSSYELGIQIEKDNWHGLFHKGLHKDEIEKIIKSLHKYFDDEKLKLVGHSMSDISAKQFWNDKLNEFNN